MKESLRISREAAEAAKTSADVSKQTIEVMESNAKKELRAYVGVQDVFFRPIVVRGDRHLEAGFGIVNNGETPAYDVRVQFNAMIAAKGDLGVRPADIMQGPTCIHPRGHWNLLREIPLLITTTIEFQLDNNIQFAWIFGSVKYVDAFGESRTTDFRYRSTLRVGEREWGAEPDSEGNNAT